MSLSDKKDKQKEGSTLSDSSVLAEPVMDLDTIVYNSNTLSPNPFIVKKPKKLNRI